MDEEFVTRMAESFQLELEKIAAAQGSGTLAKVLAGMVLGGAGALQVRSMLRDRKLGEMARLQDELSSDNPY